MSVLAYDPFLLSPPSNSFGLNFTFGLSLLGQKFWAKLSKLCRKRRETGVQISFGTIHVGNPTKRQEANKFWVIGSKNLKSQAWCNFKVGMQKFLLPLGKKQGTKYHQNGLLFLQEGPGKLCLNDLKTKKFITSKLILLSLKNHFTF